MTGASLRTIMFRQIVWQELFMPLVSPLPGSPAQLLWSKKQKRDEETHRYSKDASRSSPPQAGHNRHSYRNKHDHKEQTESPCQQRPQSVHRAHFGGFLMQNVRQLLTRTVQMALFGGATPGVDSNWKAGWLGPLVSRKLRTLLLVSG